MKLKMKQTKLKKREDKIKQKDLKFEVGKCKYDIQQYERIRSFGESIYPGKISIHKAGMNQTNLLENMKKCNDKSRPKIKEVKDKTTNFWMCKCS